MLGNLSDLQKSYEELGIFGGLRLSQFVSSLTADHCFWCSGGVPCCFEGVPGVLWDVSGCSGVVPGCSGLFRAVPGVFQECRDVPGCSGGVPGCSGLYRHPTCTGISYAMKIVHDFISVREINILRTVNPDWLESLDIWFSYVLFWVVSKSTHE